jgi:hypothetical protein
VQNIDVVSEQFHEIFREKFHVGSVVGAAPTQKDGELSESLALFLGSFGYFAELFLEHECVSLDLFNIQAGIPLKSKHCFFQLLEELLVA